MIADHLAYLALAATITVLTGRTLHRHGRAFLVDVFRGDETTADAVNNLLLVGYYLVNLGIAGWGVLCGGPSVNLQQSIEVMSLRLGVMLLILGTMHFGNVIVLCVVRKWIRMRPMEIVEFVD